MSGMQLTELILDSLNIPTTSTRVASPSKGWEEHLADARNTSMPLYSLLGAGGTEQYTYVIFQVSGPPRVRLKTVLSTHLVKNEGRPKTQTVETCEGYPASPALCCFVCSGEGEMALRLSCRKKVGTQDRQARASLHNA
jgi:hypothetical protein